MLFFSLVTGMVVASMQVRFTGFNVAVPSDSWLVLVCPESTVDRLIDVYPENQQQQIRVQVASTLRAVIVQTLIPRASGHGRAPATEVMINNPAVAALIRSGKAHQIRTVLQSGEKEGMHTLDQDLARLVNKGVITFEDALVKVQVREEFEKLCGARKSF